MDTEMILTEDLTMKAIAAYNGNLHNGMTKALDAVVAMVLEEAEDAVNTVGDHADGGAYLNAIRALKESNNE